MSYMKYRLEELAQRYIDEHPYLKLDIGIVSEMIVNGELDPEEIGE